MAGAKRATGLKRAISSIGAAIGAVNGAMDSMPGAKRANEAYGEANAAVVIGATVSTVLTSLIGRDLANSMDGANEANGEIDEYGAIEEIGAICGAEANVVNGL